MRQFLDERDRESSEPMMMYDRKGRPMNHARWVWIQETQPGYKIVGHDHIAGGIVSTVWLGLDHSFHDDMAPIIFETMLFGIDDWDEHQDRYSSADDALLGHEYIVSMLTATR